MILKKGPQELKVLVGPLIERVLTRFGRCNIKDIEI